MLQIFFRQSQPQQKPDDLVCLLHILVRGVGLLIARVAIRVMLTSQLSISFFDVVIGRRLRDAQHFVVQAFVVAVMALQTESHFAKQCGNCWWP